MKVLFCASECVPFVKTGGLADVIGALPVALKQNGTDARVILPKYGLIDEYWKSRMQHVCHFEVLFGWERVYCGVESVTDNGVTYYFIDNESFFQVTDIYGDGLNEGLRFSFFCRAVLEALPQIGFFPDVLHLNDWQSGMIAALLKTQYAGAAEYAHVRTVFSIHNLKYQGLFDWNEIAGRLGLDERYFTSEYLEFYGCLSMMKGGLVFADRISTVSPTYANEIKTPYYGENLDGLLRARENTLSGILNGVDYTIFDPETDRFLPYHYDAGRLEGKRKSKLALQEECGLAQRDVPLVGMIARLSPQKGLDLIERVLGDVMRADLQIVFLGKGDQRYVDLLNWANWRYPKRVHARIELDEGLAHRIYAGSDMFLMPSQFEPCGLSQMIALRYGSVPIVRETGGLKDTIVPYNMYTDEGNGFSFANYNAHEMLFTIERAVHYWYEDKPMWKRMMLRGMADDFSWGNPAREYLALYRSLVPPEQADGEKRPPCVRSAGARPQVAPKAPEEAEPSAVSKDPDKARPPVSSDGAGEPKSSDAPVPSPADTPQQR
jgi:starch synthase